jgi:hypothetical protein
MRDEETGSDSGDHTDRHSADYKIFLVCLPVHMFLLED